MLKNITLDKIYHYNVIYPRKNIYFIFYFYYIMDFKTLHKDTNCICINKNTIENPTDIFAHKIQSNSVSEEDFRSYWELGKRPHDINDCGKVCGCKGISIHKITNREALIRKYQDTEKIKRKVKDKYRFYCEFKLKKDAGLVQHGSNGIPNCHCNLFKCDGFNLGKIEIINILPINYDD